MALETGVTVVLGWFRSSRRLRANDSVDALAERIADDMLSS